MAITVKHTKVSSVPDSADTSLVRPSDWNADHTLTGLGTMAEQNANNVTITGGSISGTTVSGYIPSIDEGVANGVATLDSAGKVPISQIPDSVIGALSYQGTWNASTNTPTLTSSTGTKGYYYVVSVAGTTNLDGITDWQVGDWAVYNGSAWQKVDNTDGVTSVNGFTGAVTLTTTNIAEGTNEYFTTARARASLSAGTGITYNSTTGVITNSSPSLGGDVVGPSSATDNAIARYDTTTGKLIQNSVVVVNDAGTMSGVESLVFDGTIPAANPVGTMWYDQSTETLNFQQNNITQQIGEETLLYGKASSAINDSPLQIIYQTGVVGASGVITFAPTVAGITDANLILGCATEPLATNQFGRITVYGAVHGINTTGSAYGETWADGDVIWYNPVTGNPTKTKPTAPNIKVQLGIITHAGSGGSGTFQVLLRTGSSLGGTDDNVQLTSPSNGQILSYDGADSYWKNTTLTAGTGISVTASSTGVLTVTNTAPSSGGTVTAVTGTSPISSSGGTTPNISMSVASSVTDGYLTHTDWNVFYNKVYSVSATSPITSTGGTTPTIAIPAANGSTDGYLSSTDWTTFNSKGSGTVTSVAASVPSFLSVSGSPITTTGTLAISYSGTALPIANGGTNQTAYTAPSGNVKGLIYYDGTSFTNDTTVTDVGYDTSLNTLNSRNFVANNGMICNSMTVSSSYTIPVGYSATAAGPMTIASGQTVTISSGSRWVIL